MRKKRIIPCLDLKDGRVVKGTNFVGLREMGDPLQLAIDYANNGADELVLLNIAPSADSQKKVIELIPKIAKQINIPLVVGGGIKTVANVEQMIGAGANKITISSAAVSNPSLITSVAKQFGAATVVIAIDAKYKDKNKWSVMTNGGKKDTGLDVVEWAREVEQLGAGEILLTSVDKDGCKDGYDLPLMNEVASAVSIPVIASGGCGDPEHIAQVCQQTNVSAALAASIFHEGKYTANEVKEICRKRGVNMQ